MAIWARGATRCGVRQSGSSRRLVVCSLVTAGRLLSLALDGRGLLLELLCQDALGSSFVLACLHLYSLGRRVPVSAAVVDSLS